MMCPPLPMLSPPWFALKDQPAAITEFSWPLNRRGSPGYEPPFAPPHIFQRITVGLYEPERTLEGRDSVDRLFHLIEPPRRHRIAVLSGVFWIHLLHRVKRYEF